MCKSANVRGIAPGGRWRPQVAGGGVSVLTSIQSSAIDAVILSVVQPGRGATVSRPGKKGRRRPRRRVPPLLLLGQIGLDLGKKLARKLLRFIDLRGAQLPTDQIAHDTRITMKRRGTHVEPCVGRQTIDCDAVTF